MAAQKGVMGMQRSLSAFSMQSEAIRRYVRSHERLSKSRASSSFHFVVGESTVRLFSASKMVKMTF
jgi:hypothetical protein